MILDLWLHSDHKSKITAKHGRVLSSAVGS
jgi:hypothetical protein